MMEGFDAARRMRGRARERVTRSPPFAGGPRPCSLRSLGEKARRNAEAQKRNPTCASGPGALRGRPGPNELEYILLSGGAPRTSHAKI